MKVFVLSIISKLPGTSGARMRKIFYERKLRNCGTDLYIWDNVKIDCPRNISIGNRCRINSNTWISGMGKIHIGNDVQIGPRVVILTANHTFNLVDQTIYSQGSTIKNVSIGDDVWIGVNVVILPGVNIGTGCVIGAGSIVTKDIPPYSVAVGNPAKVIKMRKKQ